MGKLLAEVVELFDADRRARVTVVAPMPVLQTYRAPLHQVFQNLIANAFQHGGKSDLRVRIEAHDEDEFYRFCVIDDGVGIAESNRQRIWAIFATLRARDGHESTGIGLSLVKKICESLGGSAWVEGVVGQGSEFNVRWPKRPPLRELP